MLVLAHRGLHDDARENTLGAFAAAVAAGVDGIESRFTAAVVATNHHAAIDMSGVDFLASMGIRLFITNARAMNNKGLRMALFGATDAVQSVLESVALDQIVPIARDQQEALLALAT